MFSQELNTHKIYKQLAKALIRLHLCAGWSEALLVAHTTLLEIPCRRSYINAYPKCSKVKETWWGEIQAIPIWFLATCQNIQSWRQKTGINERRNLLTVILSNSTDPDEMVHSGPTLFLSIPHINRLHLNMLLTSKQEGSRALDRSPESWHMSRWCIDLWLRSYDTI